MLNATESGLFPYDASRLVGRLSISELATLVDAHAASLWRGEEDSDGDFYEWLLACWTECDEGEPATAPLAISRLAAGGSGIRWYESIFDYFGYVQGDQRHRYVVPKSAAPPPINQAAAR